MRAAAAAQHTVPLTVFINLHASTCQEWCLSDQWRRYTTARQVK